MCQLGGRSSWYVRAFIVLTLLVPASLSAQQISIDAHGKIQSRSGGFVFPDGSIQSSALVGVTYTAGAGLSRSENTLSIAEQGVQASMLAPNAVTSDAIADGTVGAIDIADGAVTSAKLGPPTGYLFAYATSTTEAYTEWSDIAFGVVAHADGWSYSPNFFTCASSGLYLIQYAAELGTSGAQTASLRATVDGVEISGSQASSYVLNTSATAVSKSFIAGCEAGSKLRFQYRGNSNYQIRLVANHGAGEVRPSFTVTVMRLR